MRDRGGFWKQLLSPPTARFILALLALGAAAFATFWLMSKGINADAEDAVIFALGFLFGFAKDAFSYYFGSTARGDHSPVDTHIVNKPGDPVSVEEVKP